MKEVLAFHEIKELAHPEIEDDYLAALYNLQFVNLSDDKLAAALADPEEARSLCERTEPMWLSAIDPVSEPWLGPLSKHSDVEAWHVNVDFEPLGLDVVRKKKLSRHDTYGWKAQLASEHPHLHRSVGEVEIAQRLRRAGYKAFWVDLFGQAPPIWKAWTCGVYDLPFWLQLICRPMGRRGWPDVVAWKFATEEVRFVEYKGLKDSINENQRARFRKAQERGGMDRASYVVARMEAERGARSYASHRGPRERCRTRCVLSLGSLESKTHHAPGARFP